MIGALTHDQIENVLRSEVTGRIGCHAEGRTYVVPVSYAYDGEYVYAHSADGLKVRTMRFNPNVCFEVEQIDGLANWRSIIGWGTYEELQGANEDRARQLLAERFAPLVTGETAHSPAWPCTEQDRFADNVRRSIFYRIRLTEKTGRYERHRPELVVAIANQEPWRRTEGGRVAKLLHHPTHAARAPCDARRRNHVDDEAFISEAYRNLLSAIRDLVDAYEQAGAIRGLVDAYEQVDGLLDHLVDLELDESFSAAGVAERAARIKRVAKLLSRQKDPLVHGMLKGYVDYAAGRLGLVRVGPNAFGALKRSLGNLRGVGRARLLPP